MQQGVLVRHHGREIELITLRLPFFLQVFLLYPQYSDLK